MKRWLARSLALCAFLVMLTFVAACGGGGGGGADSNSPASSNSANTTAGTSYTQSNVSQTSKESSNEYETPEPATLSMLISGIVGAGGFLIYRRRRHG